MPPAMPVIIYSNPLSRIMCRIVDQLATERGIRPDDANYIFTCISGHLINKIPALKGVIEDVFADEPADDKLQEDINKAVILLQQHMMREFRTWQMPNQSITRQQGNDEIL